MSRCWSPAAAQPVASPVDPSPPSVFVSKGCMYIINNPRFWGFVRDCFMAARSGWVRWLCNTWSVARLGLVPSSSWKLNILHRILAGSVYNHKPETRIADNVLCRAQTNSCNCSLFKWAVTAVCLCMEVFRYYPLSWVNFFKFSSTWSCVSLPRPTTSSGWKLLVFVQFEHKYLHILMIRHMFHSQ